MALRRAPAAALLGFALVSLLPVNDLVAQDEVVGRREATRRVVVLDDQACTDVPRTELRELVTLELAPHVLRVRSDERDERDDADATDVRLTCDAKSARLVVLEGTRPAQELVLDLSSIAIAARARLIALSLAELLATADMEPITPAPAAANEQTASPRVLPQSSAWLAAGVAREGTPRVLAPSLQTGLVLNLAGLPLALVAELDAQRGERDVRAGHVTLWNVSGAIGPATQLLAGPLELVLGAGVRLGYARLVGDADAGQTTVIGHVVSGLWWGPTLGASGTWRLGKRLGLRAGVDLSWIARPVRGTDSTEGNAFELDGLLVHATLGLSLALPALGLGRSQQTL